VLENESPVPALPGDQSSRTIAAARDYRLTSNTTSFALDAPGAGLAVVRTSSQRTHPHPAAISSLPT
jgi:hypothetical protein